MKPAMRLLVLLIVSALGVTVTHMPAKAAPPQPGDERQDAFGITQVWVPAGCFLMGTDAQFFEKLTDIPQWAKQEQRSEQPAHEVCLTTGYWLDKYEVTNAAFQAFVKASGYTDKQWWSADGAKWLSTQPIDKLPRKCASQASDHPRACITWYEAEAYAKWRGGRLPTEAEWEFAARGPESMIYPWGNVWDEANAHLVGQTGTTAVGSYPAGASWVGAMDMSGNVMEWVNDWLDSKYYSTSPKDDPQGPKAGRKKVEKGGWWGAPAYVGRAAYRHFEDPPTYQDHHIGCRIVSDAAAE